MSQWQGNPKTVERVLAGKGKPTARSRKLLHDFEFCAVIESEVSYGMPRTLEEAERDLREDLEEDGYHVLSLSVKPAKPRSKEGK